MVQLEKDSPAQPFYAIYVGNDIELGLFEKYRREVFAGPGILRWCESRVRVGTLQAGNDKALGKCVVQLLSPDASCLTWDFTMIVLGWASLVLGGSSVNVKTRLGLRLTLMLLRIRERRLSIYRAE